MRSKASAIDTTVLPVEPFVLGTIRLVQDIRRTIRFIILKTPVLMTIALTCGGLQLVRSDGLAWSIYDSPWIGRSPKMLKCMLIVIKMCQKPLVISISRLIPTPLSLRFYATFITSTISYFTTLRAIAGE
uniref:Odorant receptor 31 n=1 Tax=Sirex noctilio TaxID=36765 RepID=A0A857N2I1_9HYME|nr:odorant receptor 31 [Sirex noctilio]